MTDREQKELLALGTGPKLDYDQSKTFVDLFREQVERTPDAAAVVDCESQISYEELDEQSDVFARWLIDEKGVKPNDFVAVMLPRRKEFIVSVLGIWKAGAAYVPIDPEYPEERKRFMIADCAAKVVIDIETIASTTKTFHFSLFTSHFAKPSGTALVMYTSGSTGVPKGVVISHAAILCMSMAGNAFHRPWATAGYRMADIVPFSYIYSCQNLYMALIGGWELHLLPARLTADMAGLDLYLREHRINIMNTVPQMAVTLMNTYHTPLDIIGMGGAKMVMPEHGKTRVLVGYGSTETGGAVAYMMVPDKYNGKFVLGRPSAETVVVLENEDGDPVPRGEIGEICISAVCLATGYLHDEERTREVFVDRPWSKRKVFRTGDLGRWNADGVLEFHGRKDDIVKIGGNKVALAEVDAALSRIAGVKAAASALKDINGEPTLCGYYVSDAAIPEAELRSSLSVFLLSFMIPSLFVRLDDLPRLPNGKLARRSLPMPKRADYESVVAPESEFEKRVFAIVSGELGTQDFGVTTNLFSLGLTSLRALRLSVALERKLGLHIPQTVILAYPFLREWESRSVAASDAIAVEAPREDYPLADNQMGVYIEWERNRESDRYNNPFLLKIHGGDAGRLLEAVRKTLEIHPVLKTHLAERGGRIVQLRRDDAVLEIGFEKLDSEPDEEFFRKRVRPFNLLDGDLAHFTVCSSPNAVWLFFDVHHVIFDGSSLNLFLKTLSAAYRGVTAETESVTAHDYALHAERWKETDEFRACDRYFEKLLDGTESFTYPPLPGERGGEGLAMEVLTLPRATVRSFCRRCGITENSFFATVLTQVLHRVSREETVQIAMFSSGRSMTQLADAIGMFVRTLPLVSRMTEDTVLGAVKSIHSQIVETLSRDKYPYSVLSEKHGVKPNVMYVYQGDLIEEYDFGVVSAEWHRLPVSDAMSPLSVEVVPGKDRYTIRLEYERDLYGADEMKTLAKALANMARGMSESKTDTLLRDIEIVDACEREALVKLGTGEKLDYDRSKTFVDLFREQVERTPDAVAVADCDSSITYRELDERSDALARWLIKGKGVKPDDFVAVRLPRRKEFVVAVLGIWKAGAAYVPIDPEYPEERQRFTIEDCGAKVVVDEAFLKKVEKLGGGGQRNLAKPSGLAYMIYTSGSTGTPKGVMIQHPNLANFVHAIAALMKLTALDRISCCRSFSFDSHVEDIFPILTVGGSSHIMPEEVRRDLDLIRQFLFDHRITGGGYSTQQGKLLFQTYDDLPVRFAAVGGEAFSLIGCSRIPIFNMYGPTECTVAASYHILEPGPHPDNVPIGRPLPNTFAFILDRQGNLLPRRCVGELCITGPQVGKGYWKQPKLTAEKFVPMPWTRLSQSRHDGMINSASDADETSASTDLMYRTGDLCRWNDEGQLEYIGRIDNQVKLRGFRVELGEVESAMMKFPGVGAAVASVRKVNGSEVLVGYYSVVRVTHAHSAIRGVLVSHEHYVVDETAFRDFLAKSLPEYMVPSALVRLEAMPLTPSGKIDRKRLPEAVVGGATCEAPVDTLEQKIYDIVTRQLGDAVFGVTDNLISYGLTSIKAMRLSVALSAAGVNLRVAKILSRPTIREMAEAARTASDDATRIPYQTHEPQAYYPLTENQRLVYLSWLRNRDTVQYNMPCAWYIPVEAVDRTRAALIAVVNAHPHLKTHLVVKDGDIVQQRLDDAVVMVAVIDTDAEFTHEYVRARIRPFDLEGEELYRLEIHRSSAGEQRACVILDIHHILADGLSMQVFLCDLQTALSGQAIAPEQYSAYDFAIDQSALVRSAQYGAAEKWFDGQLAGKSVTVYPHSSEGASDAKPVDAIVSIASSRKEPSTSDAFETNASTRAKKATLAAAEIELAGGAVDAYCRKFGFTPGNYFLTAFLYLLHEVTREEDLLITTISSGRHSSCMMDAIGMFVTTLPVAVSGGASFWRGGVNEAVALIQRQQFQSQDYDFYPFTRMVERHGIRAEIMYEYQGGITDAASDNGLQDIGLDVAKLPLMLSVDRGGKGGAYRFQVRYDASVYSRTDMERMLKLLSVIAGGMPAATSFASVGLLDNSEVAEIVALGAGPHLDVDGTCTFARAFRQCAAAHADALAVEDADGGHSYGELDHASDVLAQALVEAGVKPNDFVALLLDRTWFFPLAVLGVHKAGSAYLPLDLESPAERLRYMLEDSQTGVLLTTRQDFENRHKNGLDAGNVHVLFLDEMNFAANVASIDLSMPAGNAYLAYTSGSTGRPKGAILHQAGIWNFICSIRRLYGHTAADRVASHRTFAFSAYVEDLAILTVGGSMHIMPSAIRKDLDQIREFLADKRITGCGFIASVAMMLLKRGELKLRYIVGGGELFTGVVSTDTPQIFHSYGPTEGTVHASVYRLERGRVYDRIPAGRPFPNTGMLVVSADRKLLPRGMAGELCLAGVQVCRGYWNRPELTAEKFVSVPWTRLSQSRHDGRVNSAFDADETSASTSLMYCTGDLARWNDEGQLEFLGRIDNQVKLRGYRVELGEIESAMMRFQGVSAAVASVRKVNGGELLVGYYSVVRVTHAHSAIRGVRVSHEHSAIRGVLVSHEHYGVDETAFRDFLAKSLPEYMVPSVFVRLDAMPVTGNGKIDRKALPEPVAAPSEHVPPATERERIALERAKALLGIDELGVTDDLMRLGLDSIRAMKLACGLPREWGVKVSDVVGAGTIRSMLVGKHDVLWFRKRYDPSKRTVAVVHGLIGTGGLSALKDELAATFNVLEVEDIFDTLLSREDIDALVSPDGYDEFIRLYVRRMRELLPEGGTLALLVGFSFGGMMAYDTACAWKDLTGQESVVMMGDSYLNMSSEAADYTVPAATYEQWRAALRGARRHADATNLIGFKDKLRLAIRGNKRSVPNYGGRVILLRALHGNKIGHDIGLMIKCRTLYRLARWIYLHLHIRDFLTSKRASKVALFELGHRRESRENFSAWKRFKPDIEMIDVDTSHSELFIDRDMLPKLVQLIRSAVPDD